MDHGCAEDGIVSGGGTREHGRVGRCRVGEEPVGHNHAVDSVGAGVIAGVGRLVLGGTG